MEGPVVQGFSFDPAHPYAGGAHRGVDVGADAGAPVPAPAAGTVSYAGTLPTSGIAVTIETGDGFAVTLTHLGTRTVAKGDTVAEGDAIGTVGPSGTPEVDGPYVHLGIRLAADPNGYLDPLSLLPVVTPEPASEPPAAVGSDSTAPATDGSASAPVAPSADASQSDPPPDPAPAPAPTPDPSVSAPVAAEPAAVEPAPAEAAPAPRSPPLPSRRLRSRRRRSPHPHTRTRTACAGSGSCRTAARAGDSCRRVAHRVPGFGARLPRAVGTRSGRDRRGRDAGGACTRTCAQSRRHRRSRP